MNERIIRAPGSDEGFRTHCCADLGQKGEMYSIIQCEGGDRSRESSSVKDAKMFLGGKRKWFDVVLI
jgi:hypothetical protein